jgi:hypothetical protein
MSKKKDYVKVKRISERLTGDPMKIRHTSKKFQDIINECNEIVEAILSKRSLSDDELRKAKKIGL